MTEPAMPQPSAEDAVAQGFEAVVGAGEAALRSFRALGVGVVGEKVPG